ncbi:MAG: hypothetical protein N2320_02055 [Candidatus Bipolaricaulota bacterium]|nr:hypothetical protein [Candidatus Bipolaricaulota bacterium]
MNVLVVLGVVLLGLAVALGPTVASLFDPLSPARAAGKFLEVVGVWGGVRDIRTELVLRGDGGEARVAVLFLAPAALRIEVLSPGEAAGEVFALRPTPGGEWLFLHHRPRLGVAVEARLPGLGGSALFPAPEELRAGLREGRIRVAYAPGTDGEGFDLRGLPGPFPRAELWVDPGTLLPWRARLYRDPDGPPALEVEVPLKEGSRSLQVNTGLELRDLFQLEPAPRRWLLAPRP